MVASRRVRASALAFFFFLASTAAAQTSLAPPPGQAPETQKFHYSPYEEATIEAALRDLRLEREPNPEGKIVEGIDTVRLEVIEKRDWATPFWSAPRFLNVFHVVTKSYVVEREVLMRPGDVYLQTLADETQRNIASLGAISLALVVTAKGHDGKVRLIVITKDVWSIRLQWNIGLTNGGLESLTINPAETNLLGTHQNLGVSYDYRPETSAVGLRYSIPRILGSRVNGLAEGNIIFNNHTGSPEGSVGLLQVQKPLWNTLVEWSWGAQLGWDEEKSRVYRNAHLASYSLDRTMKCDTPSPLCVPWMYKSDLVTAEADITRSFGWERKHNISLGVEARRRRFCVDNPQECPDLLLPSPQYDAATVASFKNRVVPVSDDRVGPFVQYTTYSTNYLRVLDLETLALQEDYSLGYRAYMRVYPIFKGLGSSRDVIGFTTGVSYTLPLGWSGAPITTKDGIARIGVESIGEVDMAQGRITDGSIQGTVRIATPRTAIGRMVVDAFVLDRYENYLRNLEGMGGAGRLRGFATNQFIGGSAASINVEYRSRHIELFKSVEVGGVLFYDFGDAFDSWKDFSAKQDAGFGARILFPQLDRVVFRVDVGFPIAPYPAGSSPVTFFVTFDQAFPMYLVTPNSAVTL